MITLLFLFCILYCVTKIRSGTGDLRFRIPRGKGFFGKCLLKDNNSNNLKRDVETLIVVKGKF